MSSDQHQAGLTSASLRLCGKLPGQEEKGDLQITALDITGNAAAVKVVEVYPNSKYTDYLSLLKFDGGWKIVNKIYVAEPLKH